MKKFELNIGLLKGAGETGAVDIKKLKEWIRATFAKIDRLAVVDGTEPTLYVSGRTYYTLKGFEEQLKNVCEEFSQEAIAYIYNGRGGLVHLDRSKWDWGEFNPSYFVRP